MKRTLFFLVIALCALPLLAEIRIIKVHSPGLEDNSLGDPPDQNVAVYLPPRYDGSSARYPVMYLLHGIAGSYEDWTNTWKVDAMFNRAILSGSTAPMIIVMPNAGNRLLGSFYLNSPVTGRWSDYVANDVVGSVDRQFRTIATRESRAVAGRQFAHIPPATEAFARALQVNRIPFRLDAYDGDHRAKVPQRLESIVLPWVSNALAH